MSPVAAPPNLLEMAGVLGSLAVGGVLVYFFLTQLFKFLGRQGTRHAATVLGNEALVGIARAMGEQTALMREIRDELKVGFKENSALLRECRDWHRDNHGALDRIEHRIGQA